MRAKKDLSWEPIIIEKGDNWWLCEEAFNNGKYLVQVTKLALTIVSKEGEPPLVFVAAPHESADFLKHLATYSYENFVRKAADVNLDAMRRFNPRKACATVLHTFMDVDKDEVIQEEMQDVLGEVTSPELFLYLLNSELCIEVDHPDELEAWEPIPYLGRARLLVQALYRRFK